MNLVLVGIDFSEPATRAVAEARALAASMRLRLDLLHVVEDAGAPALWTPDWEQREWLQQAGTDPEQLRARRGTPWVELARHAAEEDAALIVVGTHGRGGYHPVALGSTAARLAMASTRPVLVVGRRSPARTAFAAGLG